LEYLEINKGITDRTALRDLDLLIEKGVLQRIGEKKAAYYELVNVGYVGKMSDMSENILNRFFQGELKEVRAIHFFL